MSSGKPDSEDADRVAPRFARTGLARLSPRGRDDADGDVKAVSVVQLPLSTYFERQGKRPPRTYDDEWEEARNIDWDLVMPGVFSRDKPEEEEAEDEDCGSHYSPG